jgi:hypothetical protein
MRFQVPPTGWPVGQYLIFGIIDTADPTDPWAKIVAGLVPPPNSCPLDDEAYAVMRRAYSPSVLKFYGITGVVRR